MGCIPQKNCFLEASDNLANILRLEERHHETSSQCFAPRAVGENCKQKIES